MIERDSLVGRRRALRLLAAGTVTGLAGCSSSDRDSVQTETAPTDQSGTRAETESKTETEAEIKPGPDTLSGVTERWKSGLGDDVRSSPTAVDGTIYVGSDDGHIHALSADDGSKEWSFQTRRRGVRSSPAVSGGVVYVGSFDGNMYALSNECE